jgi:hypothetical protein
MPVRKAPTVQKNKERRPMKTQTELIKMLKVWLLKYKRRKNLASRKLSIAKGPGSLLEY